MKGYAFIYGVDGFGEDTNPAYEEGVYLNYKKAFSHLVKLNTSAIKNRDRDFYEDGYDPENEQYPKSDIELAKVWEAWEASDCDDIGFEAKIDELYEKHRLTDPKKICERFVNNEEPPFGFYSMIEVDIIS